MAKIVLKNPRRASEVGANVGTAFAPISPTAALSSFSEVTNFIKLVRDSNSEKLHKT